MLYAGDMAQIGSRRSWSYLFADVQRASKGIEYYSAFRFILWGSYFAVADVYSGPSGFLELVTAQPFGGLILILFAVLWIAALVDHHRLSYTAILIIRKFGCAVTVVSAFSTGFTVAAAIIEHDVLPGGLISPLALVPIVLLSVIALARPPMHYRVAAPSNE